jgi:hypothetical protein
MGGGGAGAGIGIALGGAKGEYLGTPDSYYEWASAGNASTLIAHGSGGWGGAEGDWGGAGRSDYGGVGGSYGSSGGIPANGYSNSDGQYSPRLTKGAVGVAGAALSGNSFITYAVTGTINGATL